MENLERAFGAWPRAAAAAPSDLRAWPQEQGPRAYVLANGADRQSHETALFVARPDAAVRAADLRAEPRLLLEALTALLARHELRVHPCRWASASARGARQATPPRP